ncbi:MAG TPA: hypothetical protein VGM56_11275 [Byssovorax sp.]
MSRASFDVGGGAAFELDVPAGAAPIDSAALPAFTLGPVAGAHVVARAGSRGAFGALYVACAAAPSRGFAPGVEELALARAAQIARGLPGILRLDAGRTARAGTTFRQRLDGDAALDSGPARVAGVSVLGFTHGGDEAFVCTAVCLERDARQGGRGHRSDACGSSIAGAATTGALSPPPAPDALARSVFAAAEHPALAAAALGVIAIVGAALLVTRRPTRPLR